MASLPPQSILPNIRHVLRECLACTVRPHRPCHVTQRKHESQIEISIFCGEAALKDRKTGALVRHLLWSRCCGSRRCLMNLPDDAQVAAQGRCERASLSLGVPWGRKWVYRHPSGGVNKCALHNIYSLFSLSAASQECFCVRDFADMTSAEPRDVRCAEALRPSWEWGWWDPVAYYLYFSRVGSLQDKITLPACLLSTNLLKHTHTHKKIHQSGLSVFFSFLSPTVF